jgi:predicted acyl esterase
LSRSRDVSSTHTMRLDPNRLREPRDDQYNTFPLPKSVQVRRNLRVPVRDGFDLSANLYLPASGQAYPLILACTRYDKDASPGTYLHKYSEVRRAVGCGLGDVTVSEATPFEAPDPAFALRAAGASVVQSCTVPARSFASQLALDRVAA